MEARNKLQLCILVYGILLISIIIIINLFQTKSTYFRWGVPNKEEEPLIITESS